MEPCLQGTLQLALEALMWPPLAAGPGLRAAVGRLANALVAVLGPELVPGSKAYTQTKLIIREMQVRMMAAAVICRSAQRWEGVVGSLSEVLTAACTGCAGASESGRQHRGWHLCRA